MCRHAHAALKAALLVLLILGASVLTIFPAQPAAAAPAPDANSVLILDPTITGGAGSWEATKAAGLGYTVVIASAAQWGAMTTAEFASYRALILGDPTCVVGTGPIAAAEANRAVWSPAVDGNMIIIGTDPTFHSTFGPFVGPKQLIESGIAFAGASATKTGAFITLSCYYATAPANTPVPVLDQFGAFTVVGQGGCPANSHIIAVHPALGGLTDALLSNWSCSTHEGFLLWPAAFDPLAISLDVPSPFVAPDGTTGAPYIIARGATLVSDICLSQDSEEAEVCKPHTVCAFVNNSNDCSGTGIPGINLHFEVVSGPCTGTSGDATTDADGRACFTWNCGTTGPSVLEASYTDAIGRRHFQKITTEWIACRNQDPDCSSVTGSLAELWPPNHQFVDVTVSGATDPDGDPVTITITGITQDEPTNTLGDGNTCPDASFSGATASLRAERTGNTHVPGDGRVYRISFTASDGKGGECDGSVDVCVPHDQRPGHVCVDNGQNYNSLLCSSPTPAGESSIDPDRVSIVSAKVGGGSATIEYGLPVASDVQLDVFDVLGRKITTLESSLQTVGIHTTTWNTAGVKGGVYFLRLQAGRVMVSRSILVLK